jgi:hypothetical protein
MKTFASYRAVLCAVLWTGANTMVFAENRPNILLAIGITNTAYEARAAK